MRTPSRAWIPALVLVVGACREPDEAPRPAPEAPKAAPPATPTAPVLPADAGPEPPPSVEHVVREGQSLWSIARAYRVPVNAIMRANDLASDDVRRLSKDSKLVIPGVAATVDVEAENARLDAPRDLPPLEDGAYHHLEDGESLWTLARTYDVPIEAIMERNHLEDGDLGTLGIGRAIVIPGVKPSQVGKAAPPKRRVGITHVLQPGETVWDLARVFHVSVAEIMATNALNEEGVRTLRDGTPLFLPGVEQDRTGQVRRKESARERRATAVARSLGLGTVQAAGQLLHGRVQRKWIQAAGGGAPLPGSLRWPVANGWYVRGYGSGEGGYHLAVDIMGKIGWNVRTAAPGIVGYSGDGVRGFGNVVLVIHPGGWVTLYGHNSVNFVAAGEKVSRNAILAEVGSTGISRGPHVHFELIHRNKNCDPAALFRPGVRHRSGKLSAVSPATWSNPDKRPAQVRCAPRRRHPQSRWVVHEDPEKDAEQGEP